MADDKYQVIFQGKISAGHDLETVRLAVGRLLRCDHAKLAGLFSGQPVVIKKNVDSITAQKYKAAFEKTGAVCRVKLVVDSFNGHMSSDPSVDMTCPKCHLVQKSSDSCVSCGIYVDKYLQRQAAMQAFPPNDTDMDTEVSPVETSALFAEQSSFRLRDNPARFIKTLILPDAPPLNSLVLVLKAIVLLVLLVWGGRFAFSSISANYAGESVLHLINLPFHEAGHVFFRPLGRFMTSAGGSITQIVVPLICLGVLLIQTRDAFGAGVCLWWTGQNFLDLAPYINDARAGVMPLIGGNTGRNSPYGFHDWEFLLTETGLLRYDHALARFAHIFGCLVMLLGIAWAGTVLYRDFRAGQ